MGWEAFMQAPFILPGLTSAVKGLQGRHWSEA